MGQETRTVRPTQACEEIADEPNAKGTSTEPTSKDKTDGNGKKGDKK